MKAKKSIIAICVLIIISSTIETLYAREPLHARGKNLYRLVENRTLKVYLGSMESEGKEIPSEEFRGILKDSLLARKKEKFEITDIKQEAEIIINAKILKFRYLEEDPVDHVVGGWEGLLVDAIVKQNYARVDVEFTVVRVKNERRLWYRKFYSTVTESNMPEPESIPKVLKECCKRFVFLCFGEPKR